MNTNTVNSVILGCTQIESIGSTLAQQMQDQQKLTKKKSSKVLRNIIIVGKVAKMPDFLLIQRERKRLCL